MVHVRDEEPSIITFMHKSYLYKLLLLIIEAEFMECGMQYLNLPVAHLFDLQTCCFLLNTQDNLVQKDEEQREGGCSCNLKAGLGVRRSGPSIHICHRGLMRVWKSLLDPGPVTQSAHPTDFSLWQDLNNPFLIRIKLCFPSRITLGTFSVVNQYLSNKFYQFYDPNSPKSLLHPYVSFCKRILVTFLYMPNFWRSVAWNVLQFSKLIINHKILRNASHTLIYYKLM